MESLIDGLVEDAATFVSPRLRLDSQRLGLMRILPRTSSTVSKPSTLSTLPIHLCSRQPRRRFYSRSSRVLPLCAILYHFPSPLLTPCSQRSIGRRTVDMRLLAQDLPFSCRRHAQDCLQVRKGPPRCATPDAQSTVVQHFCESSSRARSY